MAQERLTKEEWIHLLANSRSFASAHHGERVGPMETINISPGWVVNGELNPELWNKIKATAIPIMPAPDESESAIKAKKIIDDVKRKYRKDIFYLIVRDHGAFGGWSAGPIFVADLDKDPEALLREILDAAISKEPDDFLIKMKRCAHIAITGLVDTK